MAKKDDIKRTPLKASDSGKKKRTKQSTRETKVFPDKAFDPMKLFRQRLDDDNDKNAPRHMQREENVVEQEYNYPGDSKNKYDKIKAFLKNRKK